VLDEGRRDHLDAAAMLDAIEEEVVPLYYARNSSGLSPEWVRRCRHAMASVIPNFNMRRVVRDYASGLYVPAASHGSKLQADGAAVKLAEWKQRVRERWSGVRILEVREEPRGADPRAPLRMQASVALNGLTSDDIRVEFKARRLLPDARFEPAALCSFGRSQPNGQWRVEFSSAGPLGADGTAAYEVSAVPPGTGQYQLEVRIYPWHPLLTHPLEMGLLKSL
jgi:starch phosphorylase